MKIQNNPSQVTGADAQRVDRLDIKNSKSKDKALGADSLLAKEKSDAARVDLSQRAQEMKKIKELAMKEPDVDMDKVAKFQKLIDEGKYKVNTKDVADKMVDEFLLSTDYTD